MAVAGKKFIVLGLVAILVVGAIVAVAVTVAKKNKKNSSPPANKNNPSPPAKKNIPSPPANKTNDVKANKKAVETICEPTDHKDVCVETLNSASGDVTNLQDLVKIAFNLTMKKIEESQNSPEFQKLSLDLGKDPITSKAFDQCNELLSLAMRDLDRSKEKLSSLEITQIDEILDTIKIWLSAALTYEETCIDGFENTKGNASQKVREFLKIAMELTENTLGMIEEVGSALDGLGLGHGSNRRLLSTDGVPAWAGASARKILNARPNQIQADVVCAKDGSGKFKTINETIASIPKENRKNPYVVHIKEGVYKEKVVIPKELTNLVIIGDGPRKTKITGNLFAPDTSTFHAATFIVMADNFVARDIGFENTAGPDKHQSPALRVSADFVAFQNCRMDSYQDTVYAHTYRQFYRDCTISGTIDFIFGDAAAVFQNCHMLIRKCNPNQFTAVTAQGRQNKKMPTGIVIQNCTITADPENPPLPETKNYLGRPWKQFSRTIIMESDIGSLIDPEGFKEWYGESFHETSFYSEYNNRGAQANKTNRVKWKGIHDIKKEVAEMFTPVNFIAGNKWIPATKVPYIAGFFLSTPPDAADAIGLEQAGVWKKDYQKEDYVDKNKNKKKKKSG